MQPQRSPFPPPGGPRPAPPQTRYLISHAPVTIGRASDCNICLSHPTVSGHHARLTRSPDGSAVVEDLRSANGLFVNGVRVVTQRRIVVNDVLMIGPYHLVYDGSRLVFPQVTAGTAIAVRGVSKTVQNRTTGKPLTLLNSVNLTIEPGEFVGLMGEAGCGKSTLMGLLNGRATPSEGGIFFNGVSLAEAFDSLKGQIGFVPQDVIIHESLAVENALRYASLLRLPPDTEQAVVERNIGRVLDVVGLADRRRTVFSNLSGGQKKLVCIAMELLSSPRVLLLDEVTSGLDLGTEKKMMDLFRQLARDGTTVICISHYVDSLALCDKIAYLEKGHLTFFGPPQEFCSHFRISKISGIYDIQNSPSPQESEARFHRTPAFRRYIMDKAAAFIPKPVGQYNNAPPVQGGSFMRQLRILTLRNVRCLLAEPGNLAIQILLAPFVASMLCILSRSMETSSTLVHGQQQKILCFGSVLVVFFLGLFGSIREIVKEKDIYQHERFSCLKILPYVLGKITPLVLIGLLQVALVQYVVGEWGKFSVSVPYKQFTLLALTSLAGTMVGLAVSAAVPASDRAVQMMIGAVIPQLLFAGALVPVTGVAKVIAQVFVVCYWSYGSYVALLSPELQRAIDDKAPSTGANWFAYVVLVPVHSAVFFGLLLALMMAKDGIPLRRVLTSLGTIARRRRIGS